MCCVCNFLRTATIEVNFVGHIRIRDNIMVRFGYKTKSIFTRVCDNPVSYEVFEVSRMKHMSVVNRFGQRVTI